MRHFCHSRHTKPTFPLFYSRLVSTERHQRFTAGGGVSSWRRKRAGAREAIRLRRFPRGPNAARFWRPVRRTRSPTDPITYERLGMPPTEWEAAAMKLLLWGALVAAAPEV
jgi:hypothetical protein